MWQSSSDDVNRDNDTSNSCCRLILKRGGGEIPMLYASTPTNVKNLKYEIQNKKRKEY